MIHINLLPVRVSKKKAAGKQQLILFAAVIVLGYVGNFVWSSTRAAELKAVEAKARATREEIAQLDRIIGEVKNIKDQQAQLREKLDTLERLKAGRTGPVKVLDALATLTPKRLWLTKVEEKGGTLAFTGSASTIDDVSEFMTALKGNPHFTTVELTKTAAATSPTRKLEYVDFTLSAAVSYAPGAPAPPAAPGKGR
ncbi:MAG TPA: PilN domain-containing protein [Anaeromyxobacter sp.]